MKKFTSFSIILCRPDIVLPDGFYPEFAQECARLARQNDIPVVLDCGSWKPQYEELLQHADMAICSADLHPPGCSTTDDVFDFLKRITFILENIA